MQRQRTSPKTSFAKEHAWQMKQSWNVLEHFVRVGTLGSADGGDRKVVPGPSGKPGDHIGRDVSDGDSAAARLQIYPWCSTVVDAVATQTRRGHRIPCKRRSIDRQGRCRCTG